jgi:hypothetical protein
MAVATETRTEKGISLARGPALILGTILLAAGLYFLYRQHTFPPFSNFPSGTANAGGKAFGIFGANGWTGMLTAVAGGLLLFGAAQHLLAKTMSLIVGGVLLAAAIIALISGDVLGMAAANGWTELGWAVAGVILLFNTWIPRRRREVPVTGAAAATTAGTGRTAGRGVLPVRDRGAAREPAGAVPVREGGAPADGAGAPVAGDGVAAREEGGAFPARTGIERDREV